MGALPGLTGTFGTILIDPPWRFQNRTGKMAPEHKRLRRYPTMSFAEIAALPVGDYAKAQSHLYLWCPNALLSEALDIMAGWGFKYKTSFVWDKVKHNMPVGASSTRPTSSGTKSARMVDRTGGA